MKALGLWEENVEKLLTFVAGVFFKNASRFSG
jgi:hypothetical protein